MPTAALHLADFTPTDKERFWAKVNKDGPLPDQSVPHYAGLGQCWAWMGGLFNSGYGQFSLHRMPRKAHRIAWLLSHGALDDALFVLHKCDNPGCVNISHLFLGTQGDNADDRKAKGRGKWASGDAHYSRRTPERMARGAHHGWALHPEAVLRGESHPFAKITESDVVAIRKLCAEGTMSQKAIGKLFGLQQMNVSLIHQRKRWKHVP